MSRESPEVVAWLERKIAREAFQPSHESVATAEFVRATCRPIFGKVTLRVEPSKEFSFSGQAAWPAGADEYPAFVRDGILDALLIDLAVAPAGRLILEAIEWRPEESVAAAYGAAARQATCELFERSEAGGVRDNVV